MIINDIHHHIVTSPVVAGCEYDFNRFLEFRETVPGETAVFIDPSQKRLYACEKGHHYEVVSSSRLPKSLLFRCLKCGCVSYEGTDPYREDNIELCKASKDKKGVFPYLYLALNNETINEEFSFFCNNFSGLFHGIKVHPSLCQKKVSEVNFNSHYPIIIHSGMTKFDSPEDILKFAKRYHGNVLFAHMARCHINILKEIKTLPNAFIDTSPTYLPYLVASTNNGVVYNSEFWGFNNISDFFLKMIDFVGLDKIIFGSDAPYGSLLDAIKLYEQLTISDAEKKAIFESNFHLFNRIL